MQTYLPETEIVDCRGAVVLGESDAKLADTQVALAAAKAQFAAHDKHLASQDAAIKSLIRKQASILAVMFLLKIWLSNHVTFFLALQGQHEGLGASFLKSLHTRFRFPAKSDKVSSADINDDGVSDLQEAS